MKYPTFIEFVDDDLESATPQNAEIAEEGAMNAFEIKVHMLKEGLTISTIARELLPAYGGTFDSLRMMLTSVFYYNVRNDRLAELVEKTYPGIKLDKPKRQTVRDAIRRAA